MFAIPGSIHSPQSRGCHALLKQGAKLVETVEDVLEEIGGAVAHRAPRAAPAPAGDRDPILAALGHDPVGLDTLASRTGEPAQVLTAWLLELEIEGRIARLPGQRFPAPRRPLNPTRPPASELLGKHGFTALAQPTLGYSRIACLTCSSTCTKTTGVPTPVPTTPS